MPKAANWLLLIGGIVAGVASGEALDGVVRIVGTDATAHLEVSAAASTADGSRLCANDLSRRARALDSLTLHFTGAWQTSSSGTKCFAATAFSVLKTHAGHPAVVGKLIQKNAVYQVVSDDGNVTILAEISEGLHHLLGKVVILDVKEIENPADKNAQDAAVYLAVSYDEMP